MCLQFMAIMTDSSESDPQSEARLDECRDDLEPLRVDEAEPFCPGSNREALLTSGAVDLRLEMSSSDSDVYSGFLSSRVLIGCPLRARFMSYWPFIPR